MVRRARRIVAKARLFVLVSVLGLSQWSWAADELRLAPVAISKVRIEFGCGPTPTPGAPPPNCPPVSYVEFVFKGRRCDPEDFELHVRQKRSSQILVVYQRSSSDCVIPQFSWGRGEFTRIELMTGQIDPYKPIRFKNPVPIFWEPRP